MHPERRIPYQTSKSWPHSETCFQHPVRHIASCEANQVSELDRRLGSRRPDIILVHPNCFWSATISKATQAITDPLSRTARTSTTLYSTEPSSCRRICCHNRSCSLFFAVMAFGVAPLEIVVALSDLIVVRASKGRHCNHIDPNDRKEIRFR